MVDSVELPFGATPYVVDLADLDAIVLRARDLPTPPPVADLVKAALARPIGSTTLSSHEALRGVARPRVTVIVSDSTRKEPRREFLEALLCELPDARWTLAIATGTHGPSSVDELDLPSEWRGLPHSRSGRSADATSSPCIVNHDGHSSVDLVHVGTTKRGTPVRLHRCVVDADLVIATGCIRPHYFAGFGAGAKAIFPGLGFASDIRANHLLKTEPLARAGVVDGNPCRDDLTEAVSLLPTPTFLLDGVCGPRGDLQAVVAGDLRHAFHAGVALARPWFAVRARPAPVVIASDGLPVTASLYQAAKVAAAAAPFVEANGTLVLAAACADGIEPLDVVNEAIFRIGVLPRLAPGVRLVLVSNLDREAVERTLLEYAPSVASVVDDLRARTPGSRLRAIVLPNASSLLCEAIEDELPLFTEGPRS